MELNQKYVNEIQKVKEKEKLIDIWNNMKEEAFSNYKVDAKKADKMWKNLRN